MARQERFDATFYRSQSFWLNTVAGRLEPRDGLEGEHTADVAIIGAGYTGLWTAWYLRHHAPHLDVAVLEADIAGFGASGRNGGWCSAYLSGLEGWLDDPGSREGAIALQSAMFGAVDEVGRVSCLENIDCHFHKSGHVCAAVNAGQLRRGRKEVEAWHDAGFGEEHMRLIDAEAVRKRVRIAGAQGGFYMPHCATLHPAALARGLARAVVARGARLFERSPVTGLEERTLLTPGGRLRADVVLRATEGFTGADGPAAGHQIPVHSMMIATEPLNEREIEATGLRRRYCWNDLRHRVTYGQLTRDGRIAFGSRGRYHYGSTLRTDFKAGDPLFREVHTALGELFPALRDKPISHAWGGPMGVTRSLRPAVVYDPKAGSGWAGGYFGDGVGAANLAGRTLADLVLGRETDRCRLPWVNPPASSYRSWEPEPLRWLAITATNGLMGLADRAEFAGRPSAERWGRALERIFS